MSMKLKLFVVFLFLIFSVKGIAQDYKLPNNPEVGACYIRCLDYEKPFKWKKVNCDSIKYNKTKVLTKTDSIKIEQNKLKMKAYQKKLISLGYEVNVHGYPDNKTAIAHDLYLKRKKKEARKARRKKKKQA